MNPTKILAATILVFSVHVADACQIRGPSASYAQLASLIVIGQAIEGREVGSGWVIRVKVNEVLKGQALENLEAISPCGLPIRGGERVVVARISESLIVHPADMYEEVFRAAAAVDR